MTSNDNRKIVDQLRIFGRWNVAHCVHQLDNRWLLIVRLDYSLHCNERNVCWRKISPSAGCVSFGRWPIFFLHCSIIVAAAVAVTRQGIKSTPLTNFIESLRIVPHTHTPTKIQNLLEWHDQTIDWFLMQIITQSDWHGERDFDEFVKRKILMTWPQHAGGVVAVTCIANTIMVKSSTRDFYRPSTWNERVKFLALMRFNWLCNHSGRLKNVPRFLFVLRLSNASAIRFDEAFHSNGLIR